MTIDWRAQLYDQTYAAFGVAAVLTLVDGTIVAGLTVIDETRANAAEPGGLRHGLGALVIETVKPCAVVRAYELAARGVDADTLDGGVIAFNGKAWTINTHGARPAPTGAADGEIALYLILKRP